MFKKNKFGTKNLPDAINWHCSYFWDHALSKNQINNSKKTYNILSKAIAVPIVLKRSIADYIKLGNSLKDILL